MREGEGRGAFPAKKAAQANGQKQEDREETGWLEHQIARGEYGGLNMPGLILELAKDFSHHRDNGKFLKGFKQRGTWTDLSLLSSF